MSHNTDFAEQVERRRLEAEALTRSDTHLVNGEPVELFQDLPVDLRADLERVNRDRAILLAALREIGVNDPYRQSSAGIVARTAIIKIGLVP